MNSFIDDTGNEYISLKERMTERLKKAGWKYVEKPKYKQHYYTQFFSGDILINKIYLNRAKTNTRRRNENSYYLSIIEALLNFNTIEAFGKAISGLLEIHAIKKTVKEYLYKKKKVNKADDNFEKLFNLYFEGIVYIIILEMIFREVNNTIQYKQGHPFFDFCTKFNRKPTVDYSIYNNFGGLGLISKGQLSIVFELNFTLFTLYEYQWIFMHQFVASFPELVTVLHWFPLQCYKEHTESIETMKNNWNNEPTDYIGDWIDASFTHEMVGMNMLVFKMGYSGPIPKPYTSQL